ncbi:hypothetical protein [Cellulomonas endophytica]|uniref:hypothetical protein n=1 Tax=Cellulomonas endophytica TaxID=2494735 RepID=UPI001011A46B|nr:hypothetical protein [Cellulomonas endophytica]
MTTTAAAGRAGAVPAPRPTPSSPLARPGEGPPRATDPSAPTRPGPGADPGGATVPTAGVDRLAELLGTDRDALLADLRAGTDLGALLRSNRVPTAALADLLRTGLVLDTEA